MLTAAPDETLHTLNVVKEIDIAAPIEAAFAALLEEMGPEYQMPDGTPYPFKIEPWPGGRWFRDLGNNAGHLWGHVQVIKPPTLLEINGPLFMSYPAISHVQYRLTVEGSGTRLKLTHRALGLIEPQHREGVGQGWAHWINRVRERGERRAKR